MPVSFYYSPNERSHCDDAFVTATHVERLIATRSMLTGIDHCSVLSPKRTQRQAPLDSMSAYKPSLMWWNCFQFQAMHTLRLGHNSHDLFARCKLYLLASAWPETRACSVRMQGGNLLTVTEYATTSSKALRTYIYAVTPLPDGEY